MGEVVAVGRMGLLVLEEVGWCACALVSPQSKDVGVQCRTHCPCPTYICTVCLPMGAWSRKSRAMGLIHITTTRTGARKLTWSRTLRMSCQSPLQPAAPRSLHPSTGRDWSSPLSPPPSLATKPPRRPAAAEPGGSPAPETPAPPPLPPSPPAVSPNCVRGLSAAIRRASRCVWARRSPGKVRQAPRKEHRATSPSLKASLARGSLRREKAAGRGGAQTCQSRPW